MSEVLLLQACSSTEIVPGKFDGDTARYKRAYISDVIVSTDGADAETWAENKKIEASTRAKIEKIMAEKQLSAVDAGTAAAASTLVFSFRSSIDYGNRAARNFSLFTSAGKGTVSSTFQATDSVTKKIIYSASAASELKAGIAGGGMDSIIEENIDGLLDGFANPETD